MEHSTILLRLLLIFFNVAVVTFLINRPAAGGPAAHTGHTEVARDYR